MINRRDIYIIIPVYNESAFIREVISGLLQKGYIRIVVIDDGSAEDIYKQVRDLPVVYLKHRINLGQGAALQTGLNFAKSQYAEIVVTFDADGQHSAEDISRLIAPIIEEKADIVIGSRFLEGQATGMPFVRRLVLQSARFVNLLFSGLLLSDAHNGLRAMNRKAIDAINISENRMAHASEILLEIKKHRLRCDEVPVNISYTRESIKKGQSSIESIRILFDLVLHKLFK